MKVRIARDVLSRGLGLVQSVVERKSTMPVLSHALFKARRGELEVTGTNLQIVIETHLEADVEEEGGISLNARRVHDIVRSLPPGEITIETDENNRSEIRGARGTFHITGFEESDFPPLPDYREVPLVEIKANVLKAMVEKTIFAASIEDTRYNLEGLRMEVMGKSASKGVGKGIRMVATDGHRLCKVDKEVENVEKLMSIKEGLILPRRGMNELKRVLTESSDEVEEVGFGIEGNDAIFKVGNVVLIMRTLEGEYPDYSRVIPEENDKRVVADREKLLEALTRISIISDEKTKGIHFLITPGKLRIESQNPEVGDAYEELEVETNIEKLDIGYNARYLTDILSVMEGKKVEILLRDELSSGLLRSEEDEGYISVVMPMRL